MPDAAEQDDIFQPTIAPSNGDRVTQATLYKALYELDQGLSRRFTVFLEVVAGIQEDVSHVRDDFETHREDGHPKAQYEETVRAEIGLDTKKAAVIAGLAAFATSVVLLVAKFFEGGI